jgi:hypothetical protein
MYSVSMAIGAMITTPLNDSACRRKQQAHYNSLLDEHHSTLPVRYQTILIKSNVYILLFDLHTLYVSLYN